MTRPVSRLSTPFVELAEYFYCSPREIRAVSRGFQTSLRVLSREIEAANCGLKKPSVMRKIARRILSAGRLTPRLSALLSSLMKFALPYNEVYLKSRMF